MTVQKVSSGRLATLAKRLRGKPPGVIAHKAAQYGQLLLLHGFRTWDRYEQQAQRRWTSRAVTAAAAALRQDPRLLIRGDNVNAVRTFLGREGDRLAGMQALRGRVLQRRIEVFETVVDLPEWEEVRWCEDWRHGHAWPEAFFREYNFYEFEKAVPYDVKFPWELSRLNFLMIPTLLAVLERDAEWAATLARILAAWRRGNRCARSVNWYPMECAMRGVNLVQLVSLLVHGGPDATAALGHALVLCELHGRFLHRTVEFTDLRGNHFAAEIVALALLGLLLRDHVAEARHWFAYARRFLDGEILSQFHADGVHFEKSIAYHRLVTQLMLLAAIACDRSGVPISDDARSRLLEACRYSRAYLRPDGVSPLWGDSDDARAIWFDTIGARDHRGLVTMAANYFREPALRLPDHAAIEVPLFLGPEEVVPAPRSQASQPAVRHFEQGGMVCATYESSTSSTKFLAVPRESCPCASEGTGETPVALHTKEFPGRRASYFIADVGDVGFRGRGGHGHLDALSFELVLSGVPLIIDPGSYVYTGDCEARNRFRATRAHNVAQVDGSEMATLPPRQLWRLGTEADPFDVRLAVSDNSFELSARHDGYARLTDPVRCERCWRFDAARQSLTVIDRFESRESHVIERRFHLAPGLRHILGDTDLEITSPGGERFVLRWISPLSAARLVEDSVSPSYGTLVPAWTLVLTDSIAGASELAVEICAAT